MSKPQVGSVIELFGRIAEQFPEQAALLFKDRTLTYRELDRQSNQLAQVLRKKGVSQSSLVGLCISRSPEMITAVLAVLKAGGAYVPLDPEYPAVRLTYMMENARAALLLTEADKISIFKGIPVECADIHALTALAAQESVIALPPSAGQQSLVYVIYTSGSTGLPKGVAMPNRPLVNLIEWQIKESKFEPGVRTLQFSPLSFDVSFQEIFTTLCAGGTLALIDDNERLDPERLVSFLNEHRIARLFLPFVALQYLAETAVSLRLTPSALREVITAGEQLQVNRHLVEFFNKIPNCALFNHYGPTEAHVVTRYKLEGAPDTWPPLPLIGTAIDNTQMYILNAEHQPVPAGETGELYIGGIALADGYLHQPERTAERFLADPFSTESGGRMYRTGDLARFLLDGNIEFLGRADDQVKVRGYRIELGEIDAVLSSHELVKQAVTSPWEQQPGSAALACYILPRPGATPSVTDLRRYAEERLPDYMVPSAFVTVSEFPLTPSGKVDRRALPKPVRDRPALDTEYTAPGSPWEETLSNLWKEVLGMDAVGINDSFFDLGGTSLLLLRLIALLRERRQLNLPVAVFFQHPTIAALAGIVENRGAETSAALKAKERAGHMKQQSGTAVAIIGWAGRFPGANDVDTFWENLCAGRDTVTFFKDDELDASVDSELRKQPEYIKARGIIEGAEKFDAAFFGFSPREAELMDPQQRVMLEVAWQALENSGCTATDRNRLVGIYAGMGNSTYYHDNVLTRPDRIKELGAFQVMTGNEKDYIATRLAYKLNLTGPAVSIHTACSTSLVAVSHAVHALLDGQCDMALAGGVSITTPQNSGYLYQEGSMLSPDGHTRPFDVSAQGTTFNNGAAMIVVKRLDDALADGDRIYAVIRGAALNNDGADKMSFSAPSVDGQAAVVAMAHAQAGVEPESITYVEAHGTATPVGDPIEVTALTQAFRVGTDRKQFCALGSLKSNVGHLICAAGVTGLIKAALSLYHKKIPGTLYFEKPNPQLDLENSPFYVNAGLIDWPEGKTPRRAGVSSFGVGGTNAHVILEEAPSVEILAERPSRPCQLLLLSAKTETALDAATVNLAEQFLQAPETDLADAAYTLQTGRREFAYRRCAVGASSAEAIEVLEKRLPKQMVGRHLTVTKPPLVFMFPGQGAQYVNMGKNLYETEPVFRQTLDECAKILQPVLKPGLLELLYPQAGEEEAATARLQQTGYTQPAVFAVEYALAKLWMSWGFLPDAMTGHSIGEFTCACLAGVFTLEDALLLVAARGRMMQALPSGSMLSVRTAFESIEKRLPANVFPAALNAPDLCVLSGSHEAIAAVTLQLEADGIVCKLLRTSHAFHSPMMDSILEPFAAEMAKVKLSAPVIPFVSTVTGKWITAEQAVDSMYWVRQLREPVHFAAAAATLWEKPERVLLEIGPGSSCTTLARSSRRADIPARDQMAIASLSSTADDHAEWTALLLALGQLWISGLACDWKRFYAREQRRRISLPAYPFESKRYWVEPGTREISTVQTESTKPEVVVAEDDKLTPHERMVRRIQQVLEETSGEDISGANEDTTFMEMGFDSLFLTQASLAISNKFKVKITFRQLMESITTLKQLADHLEAEAPAAPPPASAASQSAPFAAVESDPPVEKKPFGAGARITTSETNVLNDRQQTALDQFSAAYRARTRKSKEMTQANRAQLADPRVVSGFRPLLKELVYPVIVNRSSGSRLWAVDGNEYVDLTCGFGSNFFGYSAPFIVKAIEEQLKKGYEIGPQHPLSGEVSKMFCEMTGLDRAAFCNTGSEAVLGAMRLARTVTGRKMIAMFTGDYHGICDEVIVRGTPSLRSVPAAPGIPPSSVENVLVLDYGDEKSLEILQARGDELAAIMVEPVQSRRPDLQPREFLHACRKIADECGAAFIIDEVITGFRVHPRGAQGIFDIKADIATYGKVVGGGMPIGVIGGVNRFMDALDGGQWQFGDASFPEVGVTYFAGTFVRHPLTMAAAKASLLYLKEQGPELQEAMNLKTAKLAVAVNTFSAEHGASLKIKHFGSLYKITFTRDEAFSDLFHTWLRNKGLHAWDARPCFLTIAHTDDDIAFIIRCLKETVDEMQAAELLSQAAVPVMKTEADGVVVVPTTEAQREIWAAVQMNPKATLAYNESVSLRLKGVLNCAALEQAVQCAFDRHDALRGTFSRDGMSMRIRSSVKVEIKWVDLSEAQSSAIQGLLDQEAETPFDLEEGSVARFCVAGFRSDEYQLIITAHHLVCDGWSIDVLVRDIGKFYSELAEGVKATRPPADRFAVYAGMEPEWLRSPENRAAEAYWLKQFEGEAPVMNMPIDRPRPPVKTFAGAREDFRLDPELTARLKKTGSSCGCTFVNLLLAAFKVFVYRQTGQTDLVIGLPSAGQSVRDCENLVGHCVNLMPLRSQLDPQMSFTDYLKQLRRVMLDAFDHQYFTFGTLVQKLNLPRDPSRVPLVPLVFNIDNGIDLNAIRFEGLSFEFVSNSRHYENFEIFLNVMDLPDGRAAMEWSYNTGLFDAETIRRHMAEFETLLNAIADHPETVLSDLPLIPADERKLMLESWNDTATVYPRDLSISILFEEIVAATPDAPAVQAAGAAAILYSELNRRANRVAHHLRKLGIREGDRVGLCFERSVDMLVSLIGILKAGGAYVPLDTACPAERLAYIMKDTAMRVVLCQSDRENALPDFKGQKIVLDEKVLRGAGDENLSVKIGSQSPAYVMYTSGSTGQPKGVVVPHRGVVRLVKNTNYVRLDAETCTLHFAPIAFDASTFELWAALLNGGRVVLYLPQAPSLEELGGIIRDFGVNTLWLTADLFRAMVSERLDDLRGVKQLLAGGDVLSVPEVKRVLTELRGCCLINGYGPTENTTFTCCCPLHTPDDFCGSVPVGRPIANTTVYILDEQMRPVPIGVTGELYTGGDGLALGYLNQPELTRHAFVSDPFSTQSGARLYRTGDRVRWLADGRIEFLGRQDRQVKVRGFRIELDGIEQVLSQHEALTQVAVTAPDIQPGRRALAAYYAVAPGRQISREELRSYLGSRLPDYMIPQYFMELEQLPLSSTGKINRKGLPIPDTGMHADCIKFTAPRTPEETALAEIWYAVLGFEKISVCDNFFDLGGHSLLAIQLIDRLGEAGYEVSVEQLFQFPTIEEMTKIISSRQAVESQDARWSSLVTLRRGRPGKTPLFFLHTAPGDVLMYSNLIHQLPGDQPCYAFQSLGLHNVLAAHRTIEAMCAHYVKLLIEFQPEGPYMLCGWCFGGTLASEMALQLRALGREVSLLAVFDVWAHPPTKWTLRLRYGLQAVRLFSVMPFERKKSYVLERIRNRFSKQMKPENIRETLQVRVTHGILKNRDEVYRLNLMATQIYKSRYYSGKVHFFRPDWLDLEFLPDLLLGWGLISDEQQVFLIPGGHRTMLTEPNVKILAAHLTQCIQSIKKLT